MRSVAGNKRSRTVDDGRAELNVEEHQMAPGRSAPGAKEGRIPSTMRTWRVHEFGTPQVMKFERVPRPEPGPREVLVKYGAAGVGPWDGWIRAGTSAVPPGEVVSVGPGVSKLRVGEPVFGVANPRLIGAYAGYSLASEEMVSCKPTSLTHGEAASSQVSISRRSVISSMVETANERRRLTLEGLRL